MRNIKKMVLSLIISPIILLAGEYSSLELPNKDYIVKAEVAGVVQSIKEKGDIFTGEFLKLDDKYEQNVLKNLKSNVSNAENLVEMRNKHYTNVLTLNGKNLIEKDDYKISLLSAKNSLLSLQKEILELNDTIDKKSYDINNMFVYDTFVDEGEYVSIGQDLFRVQDISKSKIVIYVNYEDMIKIKNSEYTISDAAYKIDNISKTTDDTNVLMYKIELIKNNDKLDVIGKNFITIKTK